MVAQNMLDVFADDLSDFVFSVSPLFSLPAVPPTGSAPSSRDPSSGEPSDFGDEAIDEVISAFKVLTEVKAVEVDTKSLVGVVVVERVVEIEATTVVEVLCSMLSFH